VNQFQRVIAWLRDGSLSVTAVLLVLATATAGWSASFISLHQFAMTHMTLGYGAAWLVPGTFDGAALGLSLLAFRAATFGRASLGSRVYVYGFTGLSSWINFVHIPDPQGRMVACLLPISAVIVFDKVLREAREAFERRHGKAVFRVRPGLLLLRLAIDGTGTREAIRGQITAIPVEALIGLGAGTLARAALPAEHPAIPSEEMPDEETGEQAPTQDPISAPPVELEPEEQTPAEAPAPRKWVNPQEERYARAVELNRLNIAAHSRPIGSPSLAKRLREEGYSVGSKSADALARQFRIAFEQAMHAPVVPYPDEAGQDGESMREDGEVPAQVNGYALLPA
jgi:hypothetical protein